MDSMRRQGDFIMKLQEQPTLSEAAKNTIMFLVIAAMVLYAVIAELFILP